MARSTTTFTLLAALFACASALNAPALRKASKGTHHAVVIAGSHGYQNYRHHADVCHAFQILSKNGVPAENIVMMYYDDVANSWQNPFKGHMFNKPSTQSAPGVDVYAGCQKDYSGNQVNKQTFAAVLAGDAKTAGGKVLTSTKDDNVPVVILLQNTFLSIERPPCFSQRACGLDFHSRALPTLCHFP